MNRFNTLFNSQKNVFIPYFTLGDPTPEHSLNMIKHVIDAGAQALELGVPFTDPVADGPTNQRAMQRALTAGMNFDIAIEMLQKIRKSYPNLPIGLLMYYNLIFHRGVDNAYQQLAEAGIDALVCPELPLEESAQHETLLKQHDIGCVHMIFPNTPDHRAQQSLQRSSAFTYVVARSGITGASNTLSVALPDRLTQLKKMHASPLVVGFGLSKPEHVTKTWQAGANGAIVASRFADWIEQHLEQPELATQHITNFIQTLSPTP